MASESSAITHEFSVVNTTNETVTILDEDHSCTCTQVKVERRSLKPGEKTTLRMTVQVPAGVAEQTIVCNIKTDHPTWAKWPYTIRFRSFPTIAIDPQHINLGIVRTDGGSSGTASKGETAWVDLYDREAGAASPSVRLREVPSGLTATLGRSPEVTRLADGTRRTRIPLTVAADGATPNGPANTAHLTVIGAGDRSSSMTVTWRTRDRLETTPATLHFGVVEASGKPVMRKLLMRAPDGQPFRIVAAEGGSSAVACRLPEDRERAGIQTFEVVFTPPSPGNGRVLSGTVRIKTDLGGEHSGCELGWSALVGLPRGEPREVESPSSSTTGGSER